MKWILYLVLLAFLFGCQPNRGGEHLLEVPSPVAAEGVFANRTKLILDTDTANEIDDLFAIARLLPDTNIDLLGICSAQWFHVWSGDSTVYQSQILNEELLSIAGRMDIPHPLGADLMMGKPWGDYDPRPSPASNFIIEQVKQLPAGEKLVVMSIGATTNLASAIAIEPSIAKHIVAYTLGFRYDFEGQFWNKDEFNIRRDLNAANFLLNQQDLEMHIMPVSVAGQYVWERAKTFENLSGVGEIGGYLKKRWETFSPSSDTWIMWDVALLQAFLNPSLANEVAVLNPPENTQRAVWMYKSIKVEDMKSDFWASTYLNITEPK